MRLDVTVRNYEEIPGIVDFLKDARVKKVNVTHVSDKGVHPLEVAKRLMDARSGIDIVLHLSTKYFASGSIEEARTSFRRTVEDAKRHGIRQLLIVSGHPRSAFDTIEALRVIMDQRLADGLHVGCAYNPYFDPSRLREEQERLRAKLAFPFVRSVYFQIGMDVGKLEKGVDTVRSIRSDVSLLGSVPVPSEATLNRLKLAGLYGVFLPNSYLLSVASAEEMTAQLMEAFKTFNMEPVVFAPHVPDLAEAKPLFR